jgi:pseudouridine kinase
VNLTTREAEILKILKQYPMISQEELASLLSISRSAAAVHISNLIRKGIIIGRGYVLREQKSIILLGGIIAAMEVNKGQEISFTVKGIGYLLSKGLVKLGEKVTVISSVGDDLLGNSIYHDLEKEGIDVRHLLKHHQLSTALEIRALKNDFVNPGALQAINDELIYTKEHLFKNALLAINDCSTGIKASGALLSFCKKHQLNNINILEDAKDITPFFNSDLLVKMNTIILRKNQLPQLGINSLRFEELVCANIIPLNPRGHFIITCQEEGVLIVSKSDIKHISLLPGQSFSEKFFAGFIYGLINGYNLSQAARIGLGNFNQLLNQA